MKRACIRTRRAWLLAQDGQGGPVARLLMNRHFRSCPECRDFAATAASITGRIPYPDYGPPPDRVARTLHLKAVAELARAREAERREENRMRVRQSLIGTCAGAAAAVLLAVALPGIYRDAARNDISGPAGGFVSDPASLEDNLDNLEDRLDCLRALIDDFDWNSTEGGNPCADT